MARYSFASNMLSVFTDCPGREKLFGNVALKTPVYDWGYTGRFGDEINWGNDSKNHTPQGVARSAWTRTGDRFVLDVTVPANTGYPPATAPPRATLVRTDGDHTVYSVPADEFTFTSARR